MKKHYVADALLLLATIVWGTSFFITKNILNDGTSPITLMMYRSFFAFMLITPIFIYKIKKDGIKWIDVKYGSIIGFFIYIGFVFQTVGADYTSASKSAFLTTLNVIFVPLILYFFYKQKIDKYTSVASIIALIGAFIMSGLSMSINVDNRLESIGDLLTFLSAIFWAIQIIKTAHYTKKVNTWVLMYFEFVVMFVLSSITTFTLNEPLYASTQSFISIFYLAAFCSVIAFWLMNYGMKYTSPEKSALIFTFEGVFGALFSFLFAREQIDLLTIIGGFVIFLALVISETKPNVYKIFKRKIIK